MSAARPTPGTDVRVVVDTNIFVPAIAGIEPEARFYTSAIRTCWKLVLSDCIAEEYRKVINEYGYRADVVVLELSKLHHMNKYRHSDADPETVEEALAPRKDRHIVAPCKEGRANLIVTHDSGILEKKTLIKNATTAEVLTLAEAQRKLDAH